MKQYPSILGISKHPTSKCIAFKKYDGSNLRWEWCRKKGFYKYGTRNHLFDTTDEIFGKAIPLFYSTYVKSLEKIFVDNRLMEPITVFTEFFGAKSFAGLHDPEDEQELILFDVWIYKKGLIDPKTFIKIFNKIKKAEIIYSGNLNKEFIQDIKHGKYPVTEGVVCKGGKEKGLWMRKIKTDAYIQKLKDTFHSKWKQYT